MFKLMVVDDEPGIRFSIQQVFADADYRVVLADSSEMAAHFMRTETPDVVLLDIRLGKEDGMQVFDRLRAIDPRCVVIFITGHGTSDTAIEAMRRGAYDYLVKPLDAVQLREVVAQAASVSQTMRRPAILDEGNSQSEQADLLVGSSPAMRNVFRQIGRVASLDDCVLILGQIGSGKELAARAVYQHSARREAPFMTINCAGRSAQQIECDLFGFEAGAFQGAERRRIGKIEQASGGTIMIDEIGDLSLELQARLLRVVEFGQFERLGGTETLTSTVRFLALSSHNLEEKVEAREFRKDLYFRLRGMTVSIPSLRERASDIPELAHYFLFRYNKQLGTSVNSISEEVLERFELYSWPGNVRELQGVLREALIRSSGPVLLPEFLPTELLREADVEVSASTDLSTYPTWDSLARDVDNWLQGETRGVYRLAMRQFDRILVTGAMKKTNGNQAVAAEVLGLSRPTLRGKIRSMKRDFPDAE